MSADTVIFEVRYMFVGEKCSRILIIIPKHFVNSVLKFEYYIDTILWIVLRLNDFLMLNQGILMWNMET